LFVLVGSDTKLKLMMNTLGNDQMLEVWAVCMAWVESTRANTRGMNRDDRDSSAVPNMRLTSQSVSMRKV
jgi:hypothetical protein